jgi:hypothetical protein
VKRAAAALILLSAFVACGKEEWNRQQLGVGNPYSETDETEPATEGEGDEAAAPASTPPADASADAPTDARPADARADARDATAG